MDVRLTQFAAGGGCACKIPPGELQGVLAGLRGPTTGPDLLVGLGTGDDAAVLRVADGLAVVSTTDFFAPVVDDPYDFGRVAATNALSDVYAMGGRPVIALNLVGWPRSILPDDVLGEVLRGGADVVAAAGGTLGGGHSIDAPEPLYGLAVTGLVDPERLLRNDAARPGLPLTLTKPLGVGILNSRHKATGEVFTCAVAVMTTLNAAASAAAVAAGVVAATDVTGFGLLGHLLTMCRASGVGARVDVGAVPVLDGVRGSVAEGFVSGGTRRNLAWVRDDLDVGPGVDEEDLLVLADAQTSGGLLVVGEVPGYPVIGETVAGPPRIVVR
ncbi:Selenide, water dikinase [Nostocoides japonicum T1-X7]|uniref:Selenide, water dikinase n=1 Tax=Nostocoides japonicum T1-X7 TaxID=1194083 RepID=A0A077M5A8_9MICO|nr:selenide, water dikinase SelD [Tetrasphaera japonica]CCH79250.1 Selenide, water dikinase [Tetrasphaera japonica T1-X7]